MKAQPRNAFISGVTLKADEQAAARRAIAAATPGPWHWVNAETDKPGFDGLARMSLRTVEEFPTAHVGDLPVFVLGDVEEVENPADAEFIALARTALPAAIDALDRVKALHHRNSETGKCVECSPAPYSPQSVAWPCATIRALDGAE